MRHIHLLVDNRQFEQLKQEARNTNMAMNELIRRKLPLPPIKEEILILRQLKTALKKKK